MKDAPDRLTDARARYATMLAAEAGSSDPRLEQVFATVPREAFLPPPPWQIMVEHRYFETTSTDPAQLYVNALVALDAGRGINNGEPALHAQWIGAVAPHPGETVCHVGAGTGYYTAMLSLLVLPEGKVFAYEIDAGLAEAARRNLEPYGNVTLIHADAVTAELRASDIVYVNAGVVAPPAAWLRSLREGGRIIFPWRPTEKIGLAVLATLAASRFSVRIVGSAWFIPCTGASDGRLSLKKPTPSGARASRSIVLASQREPDGSATAIYPDLWFSTKSTG